MLYYVIIRTISIIITIIIMHQKIAEQERGPAANFISFTRKHNKRLFVVVFFGQYV